MVKMMFRCGLFLTALASYPAYVNVCGHSSEGSAQTLEGKNLLENPNASYGAIHWRVRGEASIEETSDKNPFFVIRNKGHFFQDVALLEDSAGKYALLISRLSSERINSDGAITGLPSLYGYMMEGASETGGRIIEYLQGQQMRCSAKEENVWVPAWGIFRVAEGTGAIRFFLNQAERSGVPQNGSAARFDDLGLYIFSTETEAREFVRAFGEMYSNR